MPKASRRAGKKLKKSLAKAGWDVVSLYRNKMIKLFKAEVIYHVGKSSK